MTPLPTAGYERDAYRRALAEEIRREAARRDVDTIVIGRAIMRLRHRDPSARRVRATGHVHTVYTPLTRRALRPAAPSDPATAAIDSMTPLAPSDATASAHVQRAASDGPRPLTPAQLQQRTMPERWSNGAVDALAAIVSGQDSPADALGALAALDAAYRNVYTAPSNRMRNVRLADTGSGSRSSDVTVTRSDGTYVRTMTSRGKRTTHGTPTAAEQERALAAAEHRAGKAERAIIRECEAAEARAMAVASERPW